MMMKSLLGKGAAFALLLGLVPIAASAATDPITGLELYPGAAYPNPVSASFCGSKMKLNQYFVPNSTPKAQVLAWTTKHFAGFSHSVGKTDRSQDGFFNPAGTVGIGITGEPTGNGVFSVAYYRFSPPLTPFQQAEIIKQNSRCN